MIPAGIRDQPCFTSAQRDDRVDTAGLPHFFRGHRVTEGSGTNGGIFAEWSWDGALYLSQLDALARRDDAALRAA